MEAVIDQPTDYELERGKPMPTLSHGAIEANLAFELKLRYRQRYRVLTEVTLDTQPVGSTPDVLIYPPIALNFIDEPSRRSDAPVVCIEIQSPSQSLEEMVLKTAVYFGFGVKSCWVVLPSIKAVMVYSEPGRYQFFHDEETLVDANAGIELPLADVFA